MKLIPITPHRLGSILALAFAAAISPALRAELVFDTTQIDYTAEVGEQSYTAEFPFTNKGDATVTIADVRSSCGCTVPTLEKDVYAPGETGKIQAIFTYGARSGPQHKVITVTTDEGSYNLALNVTIPVRWELDKRVLLWNGKNAKESQSIAIDFHYGLPVELEVIEINRDRFAVETRWSHDGARLTLEITPIEIDPPGIHRIEVHLKDASGDILRVPFYIRIVK